MTDIVLGVRFDADGRPLVSVIRDSRGELDKFKKSAEESNATSAQGADANRRYAESLQAVSRFGAMTGAAIVALTGALALKIKQTNEAASSLQRMSDQTGRSVEWLQRMKYAEDQLGISNGALIRSYQELPRTLIEALGPNSQAGRALKALEIDPAQIRDTDRGMALIAARFREVRDPMTQAQLATMIFKERGEELLPYLREGPDGLRRLYEEGGRYAHITAEGARQAEQLRRQWAQLEQSGGALSRMVQSELLPPMVRYLDIFLQLQRAGNSLPAAVNATVNLPHFGANAGEQLRNIDATLAGRQETFSGLLAPGPLLQPLLGIGESNLLAARQAALANQRYEAVELGRIANAGFRDEASRRGPFRDISPSALAPGGGGSGPRGVSFQELMERDANRMYRELDRAMDAMMRLRQQYIDLADPMEPLRRQLKELDDLYAEGRITIDVYSEATMNLQERMEKLNGSNKEQLRAEKEKQDEQKRQASELKRQQEQADADRQRYANNVENALVNSIMRGFERGESIAENFWNSVKNLFLTEIITVPVRFVAGAFTGMAGALGFPGLASASGGGMGNLGGLGNLFSGGGQFFADFGNFFGNIGSVTEAGSTFGLMDAIGGFAAAHPLGLALGALGAIGLGKSLFGGNKTPATLTGKDLPAGVASYGGLAGTVYGNDANQGYRWQGEQWSGVFSSEIRGVYDRIDRLGQALGYDTSGLRGYSANVSTGQFMDAAEILPSVLAQLSDQLVRQIIPNFEELARAGETASQTLDRMGSELLDQAMGRVTAAYGLQQATSDLWLSDLSPLTATERFNRSNARYEELLGLARGGDVSAINDLQGFVRSNLGEAASYYGTANPQYRAIFEARDSEINGLSNTMINQGSEQLALLGVISGDLKNLPKSIADAIDAAAARIAQAQANAAGNVVDAVTQTATDTAIINTGAASASFYDADGNWTGPGRDPSNRG